MMVFENAIHKEDGGVAVPGILFAPGLARILGKPRGRPHHACVSGFLIRQLQGITTIPDPYH